MIHPDTELRYVNDIIGYGVFATRLIPRGTITWVQDELYQVFPLQKLAQPLCPCLREQAEVKWPWGIWRTCARSASTIIPTPQSTVIHRARRRSLLGQAAEQITALRSMTRAAHFDRQLAELL
jgi:hypothetical protein